jgi:hypothetical protein
MKGGTRFAKRHWQQFYTNKAAANKKLFGTFFIRGSAFADHLVVFARQGAPLETQMRGDLGYLASFRREVESAESFVVQG